MNLSAAMCRAQQALQLEIAANDPLENRRQIASTAAKAWEIRAEEAEKSESGETNPQSKLDSQITQEFADETKLEKAQDAD
jgi:hypothetical protein